MTLPISAHSSMRSRPRPMELTEEERQILLEQLAEIAAELDTLQERTAQIAARVTPRSSTSSSVRPDGLRIRTWPR